MIDWITALIPCTHEPLRSGFVCKIDPDGVQEWATPCRTIIEGSHEANITVTSDGSDGNGKATHLKISGNPSKFLQGHNIFGTDDLVPLMKDTFNKITRYLSLNPTIADIKSVKEGAYRITCIDINHSYELNSRTDVLAWLRASEFKSKTRHGRPSTKGGTVYWGQHSKRWALKAYCKAEEIQVPKHKLPTTLIDTPLIPWVENKLRIELRLKSKELDENQLSEAKNWTKETTNSVFQEYLGRLQMTEQIKITDEQLLQLPHRIRTTYLLWKDGHDLREMLPKATYYRHRKELLSFGVNIDLSQEKNIVTNVVPLIRVLEAKPATIPDWAFELDLIHHSAA